MIDVDTFPYFVLFYTIVLHLYSFYIFVVYNLIKVRLKFIAEYLINFNQRVKRMF